MGFLQILFNIPGREEVKYNAPTCQDNFLAFLS